MSDIYPAPNLPGNELALQRQVSDLTMQNQQLQQQLGHMASRIATLESRQPNTSLLSPNFLTRAFSIWGYNFVASLMIGVVVWCITFAILMAAGVSLGSLSGLNW